MQYCQKGNDVILKDAKCFDVALSLDCGQAFRWHEASDGVWHGVAFSTPLTLSRHGDEIIFYDTTIKDFEAIWFDYFDLGRNYEPICDRFGQDENLRCAVEKYYGIRILKQEPWEALCSFIISQNNNIPRIKGIIERLCQGFGDDLGNGDFSFPSAKRLSVLAVDDLAPLRAGFRAKYIIDAARKVTDLQVDLKKICNEDIDSARADLKQIKGVGDKVAECTLLYGFNRVEAFPVDVWVRRIMQTMYPQGLPPCTAGVEGIAQQYLFHYIRNKK